MTSNLLDFLREASEHPRVQQIMAIVGSSEFIMMFFILTLIFFAVIHFDIFCQCSGMKFNDNGDCIVIKGAHEMRKTKFCVCLQSQHTNQLSETKEAPGVTFWSKVESILSALKGFFQNLFQKDEYPVVYSKVANKEGCVEQMYEIKEKTCRSPERIHELEKSKSVSPMCTKSVGGFDDTDDESSINIIKAYERPVTKAVYKESPKPEAMLLSDFSSMSQWTEDEATCICLIILLSQPIDLDTRLLTFLTRLNPRNPTV